MQFFGNLRLAVRLAIAFGALAIGLLLVGGVAVQEMAGLKDRADQIGEHHMRANMLSGELGERAQTIGHYIAQHLYVYDGDLKAQDEVQAKAEELVAANTRDGKTLQQLLEGSPSEDEMRTFAALARSTWRTGRRPWRSRARRRSPASRSATARAPCTRPRSRRAPRPSPRRRSTCRRPSPRAPTQPCPKPTPPPPAGRARSSSSP